MKVKFMPDIYAILGDSNTRKSSTVRALTGAPMQYDTWTVARTPPTGNIDVYIEIKALQESDIQPQDFVNKIADLDKFLIKQGHHTVNHILIPLRISAFNNFPDGIDYLKHFAGTTGWNIQPIVVLGVATLPTALAGFPSLRPVTMPANGIASQIRPLWNWL